MRAEHSDHCRGVTLATVLYFVVVVGVLAATVLAATRRLTPAGDRVALDAQLLTAAESAVYGELADWQSAARARQRVGTTVSRTVAATRPAQEILLHVTRLSVRVYSLVAHARAANGIVRRVNLLVRVPFPGAAPNTALVSAGSLLLGQDVRVIADSTNCGAEQPSAVMLAPGARLLSADGQPMRAAPSVVENPLAADSATYTRIGGVWWNELAARADVVLARDAHVSPSPQIGGDRCVESETNWGDPTGGEPVSACGRRVPLVYAQGDLHIDGGRGQGTLLVNGRLRITGPFVYSGQIVARGGIESLSDGVELTGIVMSAARDVGDTTHGVGAPVALRYAITLRASGCDAQHSIASWLEPRVVRHRAWSELF
jgi:hypothetical protein